MKILFLSTSDIEGGASRGAYRLYTGLCKIGIKVSMLVQHKFSDDPFVFASTNKISRILAILYPYLDALPLLLYPHRKRTVWSIGWVPHFLKKRIEELKPDVVNLHWVGAGFVPIRTVSTVKQPIVWTLRDMWPLTGGCHYDQGCGRYQQSCGMCPQLRSTNEHDLSRWIWKHKQHYWSKQNIIIVAISHWLAECAKASSLFSNNRIEVIHNGLDTTIYRPINKSFARQLLGLSPEKKLILFGAIKSISDHRKGYFLLVDALHKFVHQGDGWKKTECIVFGSSHDQSDRSNLGLPITYVGHLHDDISLALFYSAADVMVLPSIQEGLGNVVLESLACGTPCVGFNIGGIPDMIEHKLNGYLSQPYVVEDLAQGIAWVLEDAERWQRLSRRAREKVEQEFALEKVAAAYRRLYEEVIKD